MRFLRITLGVMTAIGGFVDIGNLVTSGITGARFGMALTWAVVVGTMGMTLYGEMAGRVAAVAQRPVFHVIRERLGVRASMINLVAFVLLSVLTLAAEIGGVALVIEIITGLNYLVWIPLVAALVWLVVWRMSFTIMENLFGILGLSLLVYVVALFVMATDWGSLWHGATHPWVPADQGHPMYLFYTVSLFGACLVPYQVVFFSGLDRGPLRRRRPGRDLRTGQGGHRPRRSGRGQEADRHLAGMSFAECPSPKAAPAYDVYQRTTDGVVRVILSP